MDTTFDLFGCLGADDEACDFPVVYASGFNGVASTEGPDKLEKAAMWALDLKRIESNWSLHVAL